MTKLLKNGANPNKKNKYGNTPIHISASLPNPEETFKCLC